jgi:predicted ATPase/class 3 adenylate cyclase
MNIPSGNVTFLFTDVEGSTRLSQEYPELLQSSMDRHHAIMHKALESNNGFVFEIIGDAFCCAFEKAEDAVKAAVDAQLDLANEYWGVVVIKARIGIHTGSAEWNGSKYMGYITLARSARVASCGYGEQIIISNSTYELCRDKFDAVKEKNISFRDLGEKRMKDVIQPIRLFQIVSQGLREDFSPLKTLDSRPNNLPVQLTSFIGREKELSEIKKLLSSARLLTLTGPGGTGKTRLSLHAAAELIDEYMNGVWIVELASLSDPLLVTITIAGALRVSEIPGQDTIVTLMNYLKEKEMIIILDNCEHLIDECAGIADKLLGKCPGLRIIATSREALRSHGEKVYRVLSLSHPEPDQKNTPLELTQFEAVRLFIERALAVNSNFRVSNENAPSLAQICFQLDGIPLAIELAAARIKVLSVEQICEKLNDRFRLLTGGKRTALPRQQTLKALIDWSYDLLTDSEKLIFQRLSVFSGGWTLAAAEEICSGDDIDSYEVMDVHSNLLDKSLISTSEHSDSIRFHMLESIKQYSGEKLISTEETFKKHFSFFSEIAGHEEVRNSGLNQNKWLKLVDAESDNIRAAIQWAFINQPEEACKLVYKMIDYWDIKGYFREAYQTCQKFLSSDTELGKLSKANILYCAGLMSQNLGNINEAEILTKEGLSIFRELDNRFGIGKCVGILGVASATDPGRSAESREYYKEAVSIFKDTEHKRDYAVSIYNLSYEYLKQGNSEKSMQLRMEALKIYNDLEDTHHIAMIKSSMGVFERGRKNYGQAITYSEESLAISNELDDKYLISINLINLGIIYLEKEKFEKAAALLKESIDILRERGYKSSIIVALMFLGEVGVKTGDFENSLSCYKESVLTGNESGNFYYLASNLFGLGSAYFGLKEYELSLKYFAFVKTLTADRFDPISQEKKDIAEDHLNKLKQILGDDIYYALMGEALKFSKEEMICQISNS